MSIRSRLFLAFLVLVAVGFYVLVDWILDDLKPRYLATMEESMVDTATVLSSLVANEVEAGAIQPGALRLAFDDAQKRDFSARIYEFTKTGLGMRVYITDAAGIVVFDSDNGNDQGEDYSQWNDVVRTLRGEYGARATRRDPDDPASEILYVASPIEVDGDILGVLTVSKPADSVALFLKTARRQVALAGIVAAVAVVVLGMLVSWWITSPISKLTRHAQAVRDGRRAPAPSLGSSEVGVLGTAFEEMRRALEGKQYVENYVQALTHQMKSPLAAIHGAAELLEEDMPPEQRRRFLANLRSESARIQDLVDRMLQLSALENRNQLRDVEDLELGDLLAQIVDSMEPGFSPKCIQVRTECGEPVIVQGECFLVRQALANLLQNAVDFSPAGGIVMASIEEQDGQAVIRVSDHGPGIPDYALGKVFERFYSLQRPDTGTKSSGLGLAFVKEVAELHGGRAFLENRTGGGTEATLCLPTRANTAKS